jgi:transketolase
VVDNTDDEILELEKKAKVIRKHVLIMTHAAGSGHPGGSLSYADIMTALYFKVMNHRPENPSWDGRDRLVLSKGHAAPTYYAVLAETGYFPVEELLTLRKLGSRLQGHPSRSKTPGVEMSTGSLGQGLSVANGMALAAKMDGKQHRVYCLCGDGEMESGQIWEAAMLGAHYKLDNVTAFIDKNGLQIDGPTGKAFGWNVIEIDGHSMKEIVTACERAKQVKGKPTMIIANTIKGKGVSFMEGSLKFHGNPPNDEELEIALNELGVSE